VNFLEDVKYSSTLHFDVHAFRTENYEGVKEFSRGCTGTYLILKEKTEHRNKDREFHSLGADITSECCYIGSLLGSTAKSFFKKSITKLDRIEISKRRMSFELVDQLTMGIHLGVRRIARSKEKQLY